MSTKETSADKTKYRLAEAAKMCFAEPLLRRENRLSFSKRL